ncbi:MAG TPA: hypothetical protein VEI57_07965, partial [Nitrospirota bacterium]|nr:hypothetical protein [Nitrospirota bacterium]
MNLRKLVCPYDTSLIRSFSRREIAVRVDSPLLVRDAADVVRALGNNLICVILDSTKPLDAAPLQNEWKGVPLALVTASVGKFREVVKKLPLLRELNIRVCLPASNENIRDVRILSSAGVPSTIMINGPEVDWDALSDLMTYSLFGRIPHAPIGPFDYIVHHYDSAPHLCWGAAFFEDPQQFFHIDNKRNVALSREELLAEKFIGCIDEVEKAGSREIEN